MAIGAASSIIANQQYGACSPEDMRTRYRALQGLKSRRCWVPTTSRGRFVKHPVQNTACYCGLTLHDVSRATEGATTLGLSFSGVHVTNHRRSTQSMWLTSDIFYNICSAWAVHRAKSSRELHQYRLRECANANCKVTCKPEPSPRPKKKSRMKHLGRSIDMNVATPDVTI